MFLDELTGSGNFVRDAANLAQAFREKHGLPGVHQLGLVVQDVEATAGTLEAKGIGPFFIAAGKPVLWRELGEDRRFSGRLAMAFHQGFELELLEPGEGSDFYRQSLGPERSIVVQHLGLLVPKVDEWAEKLSIRGYPVRVRGKIKSGPLAIDFAYMDTASDAGLIIEFISWRIMGLPFRPRAGIINALARLEKLSGKRSWSL